MNELKVQVLEGGYTPTRAHGTDAGLDVFRTQHALHLIVSGVLAGPGAVATGGGTQPVVDADQELVGRVATLTDEVLTVDIETNEH